MISSMNIVFLIVLSVTILADGRTMNNPDPLMPLILSSVNTDVSNIIPFMNGHNRLKHIIEQIIKYVSSIRSSEDFLENIVNRQKDVGDKIKVLTFLKKCFELTRDVIQYEIDYLSIKQTSSSSFTTEDLELAQNRINDLLVHIEKRMATLKAWIPPTMPFLGFF